MTHPIVIPPLVSQTVARALQERHDRQGLPGMTRTAALTAVELAQSPVTTSEVVRRVAAWHHANPEATTADGRSTLLGGVWGGRAGRDWALDMANRLGMVAAVPAGPVASGIAVVAQDTGRVLLLQRALDDTDPATGRWEWPGGKLEPGEGALESARREFSEETGLPVPGRLAGEWTSPNGVYQGFVFEVEHEADVLLNPDPQRRIIDDPDGDGSECHAWWAIDDARDNPVMRDEVRDSTPWDELAAHQAQTASIGDPLDIIRDIPGAKASKRMKLRRLSKRLQSIDRDTRHKLHAGAEVALASGLRRAGVKVAQRAQKKSAGVRAALEAADGRLGPAVLAAIGITEQEALDRAFDDYGQQADRWLTAAQAARLGVLADELELDPDELEATYGDRMATAKDAAVAGLLVALSGLAFSRLADPHPLTPSAGESAVSDVPGGIINAALVMADGRTTTDGNSDPFAEGVTFDIVAGNTEGVVETLTWTESSSGRPFDPHTDLEGTSATADTYQDQWAKDPGEFPYGTEWWAPFDHDGCGHDWESSFDVPEGGD